MWQRQVYERSGLADPPQLVERLCDIASPRHCPSDEQFIDAAIAKR
jgi:hypothetical protein